MKNKILFIFDLDGTLIDSREAIIQSFQYALEKSNFPKAAEEDIVKYIGLPLETAFKYLTRKPEELIDQFYIDQFISDYRAAYSVNSDLIKPFPGIKKMLETLSKKGTNGIATSKKTQSAYRNLLTTSLLQYIGHVIGEDVVEQKKPHPESIYMLLHIFNKRAEDTIMIGDSPFDIQMGQAANVKTIGVTWGATSRKDMEKAEPTYIVDTVDELTKYLV